MGVKSIIKMSEDILLNIPVGVYNLVNGNSWEPKGNSDYNLIIAKDKNTNNSRILVQDPSSNTVCILSIKL